MNSVPGDIDKSIYLASPFTHRDMAVMIDRHAQVCKVAGEMMKWGKLVFSPIAHTFSIAQLCDIQGGWDDQLIWKRQDLNMLEKMDEFGVVAIDGWQDSIGLLAEWNYAIKLGKPIHRIAPEDWLCL